MSDKTTGSQVTTFSFGNLPLRSIMKDGQPWFALHDVCKALDITNVGNAASRLDADEKVVRSMDTPGGVQRITVVNEAGLYSMILRCRDAITPGSPSHKFKRWVTHEVLPALRKDGAYIVGEEKVKTGEMSEDELISKGFMLLHAKAERLVKELASSKEENVALEHKNSELSSANAEMSKELNEVTIDEYRALSHDYWSLSKTHRIARTAANLARCKGVDLQRQRRTIRKYNREIETQVYVYPRAILDEAVGIYLQSQHA